MSFLEELDALQDTMDGNLKRGLRIEAAQDALEIIERLRNLVNADDPMSDVLARSTVRYLLGDEGRTMRKEQGNE